MELSELFWPKLQQVKDRKLVKFVKLPFCSWFKWRTRVCAGLPILSSPLKIRVTHDGTIHYRLLRPPPPSHTNLWKTCEILWYTLYSFIYYNNGVLVLKLPLLLKCISYIWFSQTLPNPVLIYTCTAQYHYNNSIIISF